MEFDAVPRFGWRLISQPRGCQDRAGLSDEKLRTHFCSNNNADLTRRPDCTYPIIGSAAVS
jgi:hypothetical protein